MKLQLATLTLTSLILARREHAATAQTCEGVSGDFALTDITGTCSYGVILEEYARQVFDATGQTCAGSTLTAQEDLDGKLIAAAKTADPSFDMDADDAAYRAGMAVCRALYDGADVT